MSTEWINRYTYAVTQKIPAAQRADIEKELRGLIEDMLADRAQGREPDAKDLESVLLELGDPNVLADKYRGYKHYLISPEIFPTYLTILKIVFGALSIAMLVLFTIQTILNPAGILGYFLSTLGTYAMGCLQAFAWVTLIFGLIDYLGIQKQNLPKLDDEPWSPAKLPELPVEDIRIPRSEPVAGIIFTVIFVVLVSFAIRFLGIWFWNNGGPITYVPFMNEAVFQGYVPFIVITAMLSIVNQVLQLVSGKWTPRLMAFNAFTSLVNFALAFVMFSNPAIWNADFIQQLTQAGLIVPNSAGFQTASAAWKQVTGNFTVFLAVIFAIEVITTGVKITKIRKAGV